MGQSKDPGGKQIRAYGMPTDQQNNVYQLEFGGASIGMRDAKTGQVTIYRTPTAGSKPRRGRVDAQNRLWFAEYGGNAHRLLRSEDGRDQGMAGCRPSGACPMTWCRPRTPRKCGPARC